MTTSNPTPRPLRRFVLVLLTALMMLTTVGVTAPNADAAPAYGGWSSTAIRTLCQLNGDSARESVDYYELGAIDDDGNRTQYRFRLICEFTHDEKDVSIRCNAFGTHWVDWLMFKAGAETSMTCTFDVTPHSNDEATTTAPSTALSCMVALTASTWTTLLTPLTLFEKSMWTTLVAQLRTPVEQAVC